MKDSTPSNPVSSRPLTCLHPALLFVFVVLATFFYLQQKNKNSSKRKIPGPRGWPVVGCVPYFIRNPLGKMREYADKYGPIYTMKLGPKSIVVLNSVEAVKEAFVTKGTLFNDRPSFFAEMIGIKGGLVLLPYGKFHNEQRALFSKVMRRMDAYIFDNFVVTNVTKMKQSLRDSDQTPVDICKLAGDVVFASVGQMIFGKDTEVSHIQKLVEGSLSNNPIVVLSGKLIPESLKPKLGKYVDMSSKVQKCFIKIKDLVNCRQKQLDLSRGFSDIVEGFLHIYQEIKEDHECSSKTESPFVDEEQSTSNAQLAAILLDCYNAGMESTTAQVFWLLLYLARFPDVQRKIQEEMDRVIGRDITPLIKHKQQHNYTLATINEVQRMRPAVSLGAPHASKVDASILGYDIPADTLILSNIWAVHMDPRHWENPEEFRPERFLDDEGNVTRPEAFIPFSFGNRQCVGIKIAQNMMFLIVAHILQDFNLVIAEEPAAGFGKQGINFSPYDFTVIATPRPQQAFNTCNE